MKYFSGDLVQDKDLEKVARQRKKEYSEITVLKELQSKYLKKGWKVKKKFKERVRLRKEKKSDELLEDKVWLLFKNMGFQKMNKDRNFKIKTGLIYKQIDVFAKDDKNIFIVECKALSKEGPRPLRKDIHEILGIKKNIIDSIRKKYKKNFRFSFLLVTKNIIWSSTDERFAKANKKKGFFFWKEPELQAFTNLASQFGEHSKYLMYSILLGKRKIPELSEIQVPAIYGGKGKSKYYFFIIQPEKLLQGIAYVHRREESDPEEAMGTYQRMVQKNRLTNINEFINRGGYFPNNIILNFTQKPKFERKSTTGDIAYGILTFPPHYGSAWIIDGQHRLYGYLNTQRKATANLPVLAFEGLSVEKQAKLFVDINQEQKKVGANLLWDLYPDIYRDTSDPQQQQLRAISLIVKKLNSEQDSPLCQRIKMPGASKKKQKLANLTLRSICTGIKENRLINMEENLLFHEDYEQTVDFAYDRLKEYFGILAKSFPQDWKKGDKGLLCSNVGIRIFLNIFKQLLKYLNYEGLKKVYTKKDLTDFVHRSQKVINPILENIKSMSDEERNEIRGQSNKRLIRQNTQRLVWGLREKINFGLELWIKGGWTPGIPETESDDHIKILIDDTETEAMSFIIQELKKLHRKLWWKNGIPEGVKEYIKRVIKNDIQGSPWKEKKLLSLSLEDKLKRASTSHLKEIIINNSNWNQFKRSFAKDKEIVSAAFKFYEMTRNKYKHPGREKEITEIEKGLGYWNMKWIRKCIGLD